MGFQLIRALLDDPDGPTTLLKAKLPPKIFTSQEKPAYQFCVDHLAEHGVLPAESTLAHELGVTLPEADEPPTYWLNRLDTRHRYNVLRKAVQESREALQGNQSNKALALLEAAVLDLTEHKQRHDIVNVKEEAAGLIEQDLHLKQKLGMDFGIQTGWPYLDDLSGGFQPGDYISVVGRPGQGKSYLMLFIAIHMWQTTGKTPLFVSMEMLPLPLVQRVAAMLTQTPSKLFMKAGLGGKAKDNVLSGLQQIADSDMPPFYIVNGNLSAKPSEVLALTKQLKPDCVFIDGAYLMQMDTPQTIDWVRIKSTVEECKSTIAQGMSIPVVGSFQFSKPPKKVGKKDPKKDRPTLDDIGGSDAIAQISTMILGLLQDETIDTIERKRIEVLKGRNGEFGYFDINWLFETWPYMDFTQVKDETDATTELEFF